MVIGTAGNDCHAVLISLPHFPLDLFLGHAAPVAGLGIGITGLDPAQQLQAAVPGILDCIHQNSGIRSGRFSHIAVSRTGKLHPDLLWRPDVMVCDRDGLHAQGCGVVDQLLRRVRPVRPCGMTVQVHRIVGPVSGEILRACRDGDFLQIVSCHSFLSEDFCLSLCPARASGTGRLQPLCT